MFRNFCKGLRHVSLYGYTKLMMYRDGCAGRNVPLVVVDRQKELLQSGGGSFQPDVVSLHEELHMICFYFLQKAMILFQILLEHYIGSTGQKLINSEEIE